MSFTRSLAKKAKKDPSWTNNVVKKKKNRKSDYQIKLESWHIARLMEQITTPVITSAIQHAIILP